MDSDSQPIVSVGVPVFNGARGLARCLDGLLQQDYSNLEIVISDNGSTDDTPAICEEYVSRDRRVRYVRSHENRGWIWNFNRVCELSSGKYFMFAAHDDERESTFVSECVRRLEERPDAVLCAAHTSVSIESRDEVLYVTRFDTVVDRAAVVKRYHETLRHLPITAIYGVYRTSAMRATGMFRRVMGTDTAFIRELMIYGSLVQVPEALFKYRARKTWNTIHQDARAYLAMDRKPWWYIPFCALFADQFTRLIRAPVMLGLKLQLMGVLVLHEASEAAGKVVVKLTGVLCPDGKKEQVGRILSRQLMHNPNIQIVEPDLYFERVTKPQLGWWR